MDDEQVRDELERRGLERVRNGEDVGLGALWAAFLDFRGEVRGDFGEVKEHLKGTNGRLREHDLKLAMYAGGLCVLGIEVTVFGGVLLAKALEIVS